MSPEQRKMALAAMTPDQKVSSLAAMFPEQRAAAMAVMTPDENAEALSAMNPRQKACHPYSAIGHKPPPECASPLAPHKKVSRLPPGQKMCLPHPEVKP